MRKYGITPGLWRVRQHPMFHNEYFVEADVYKAHPYRGRASGIQILSDEDYPTKRADAEAIAAVPELIACLEGLLAYESTLADVNKAKALLDRLAKKS